MQGVKVLVTACLATLLAACVPVASAPGAAPTLPPDWTTREAAGLRIAAPKAWLGPEVLPARDAAGPRAWIVFRDPSGAETLTLMTWLDTTATALAAAQFHSEVPRGDLQDLTLGEGTRTRSAVAVTGYAQWSDATASGTYECRHLFVQVDVALVADVIACGARVRGNATPTPELRRTQDRVALLLGPAGGQP
jgi:hypothetical protein